MNPARNVSFKIFVLLFFIMSSPVIMSQEQIQVLNADKNSYRPQTNKARVLSGNVIIEHQGAMLYCDKAYYYDTANMAKAFGHVQINRADTLNIYGDTIYYEGNTKKATVFGNVKLVDDNSILRTPSLHYNLDSNIAYYNNGGFMTDMHTGDTLISDQGVFYGNKSEIEFTGNVYYKNENYTIISDKMSYNTDEGKIYYKGPTTIVSDENTIYCEKGWYDTRNNISSFSGNSEIHSNDQLIKGDSIYYNRQNGEGEIFGNLSIRDSVNKVKITGGYGKYNEKEGRYQVTQNPILEKYNDLDTLFLKADTIFADIDTINNQNSILAHRHVQFMQGQLYGKCDSLYYNESDSVLNMFYDPVLWQDSSQLSSDTIFIRIFDGLIQKLDMKNHAMIVSQVDSIKYNQISGKNMYGFFSENNLQTVRVIGNGQTVYYTENDTGEIIGMDYSICSDIRIQLNEDKIEKIVFINSPTSTMYPIDKVPEDKKILKGFKWRIAEKKKIIF